MLLSKDLKNLKVEKNEEQKYQELNHRHDSYLSTRSKALYVASLIVGVPLSLSHLFETLNSL